MTTALRELTDVQQEIVRTARAFAETELAPHVAEWDRAGRTPRATVAKLGELGFLGMLLPEEWGGSGLDTLTYLLALEEIARVDPSTALTMSVHSSLPSGLVLRHGTDETRRRYLPSMATGEMLGAFALSENHAGSDPSRLSCRARRDGEAYVLDGAKAWVTNGATADVVVVFARTGGEGARGVSAFLVETGWEGYAVGKEEKKMGLRASNTAEIVLTGLRVPAGHRLGEEGRGLEYAFAGLDHGRLGIAAQSLGIAQACLDLAVAYARERHSFGHPIAEFQGLRFMLAELAAQIAAARALTHATAEKKDQGRDTRKEAAMAKLLASRAAMTAAVQAVQVYGGYGYIKDYPVERWFRDAKATEIYEGTSEIQKIVIARQLFGD